MSFKSNKLLASLTKKQLEALRKNYTFNNTLIQKGLNPKDFEIVVKFFNPIGIEAWYLTELSPENIGFGICHISQFELGYVDLDELTTLKLPMGFSIEKDIYFSSNGLNLSSMLKKLKEENK